ncbi:MAG: CoA ester lyase [Alphaproteobacteria bacterium]|nr:CoA ester lyase [Alphaproteobacteria bacterium]
MTKQPEIRPRRSALYVPGSNARALEKAREFDADVLVFDLEDGVAPDRKEQAREQITAALAKGGFDAELVIRINDPTTRLGAADLKAAARSGCHAVLLPKTEGAQGVRDAALRLASSGAPPTMALWAMIETPMGVMRVEEIAFSSPHLKALVMGTSDLAKDLRARHTHDRLPVLTALSLSVMAARAAGLAIIDGVHLDLDDDSGFQAACRQGSELGFDGKTLIHPKTIAAANGAFGPTPGEVEWAVRIIEAHGQALKDGRGVAVVDGKLIENLHVESARRTVALAEAITARTARRRAG